MISRNWGALAITTAACGIVIFKYHIPIAESIAYGLLQYCHGQVPTTKRLNEKIHILKNKSIANQELVKGLQQEVQQQKQARFVLEKCYEGRLKEMDMEIGFKDQEILALKDALLNTDFGIYTEVPPLPPIQPRDLPSIPCKDYDDQGAVTGKKNGIVDCKSNLTELVYQLLLTNAAPRTILVDLEQFKNSYDMNNDDALAAVTISMLKTCNTKRLWSKGHQLLPFFEQYLPIISRFLDTSSDQRILLECLHNYEPETNVFYLVQVVMAWYELDLVSSECITNWHHSQTGKLRNACNEFVEWLDQESDSESDASDAPDYPDLTLSPAPPDLIRENSDFRKVHFEGLQAEFSQS